MTKNVNGGTALHLGGSPIGCPFPNRRKEIDMNIVTQILLVLLLIVICSVLINIDSNFVNLARFLDASYWRERGERTKNGDE